MMGFKKGNPLKSFILVVIFILFIGSNFHPLESSALIVPSTKLTILIYRKLSIIIYRLQYVLNRGLGRGPVNN